MKRQLMLVFMGLVTTMMLTACNSGDSDDGDREPVAEAPNEGGEQSEDVIEISFWHAMSGVHEDALNEIIADFNEAHEHIVVTGTNQGSYSDLSQILMANARANTLPHLAQTVADTTNQYIDNNFILPLNDFIEDTEIGLTEAEIADIIEIFREGSMWQDTYYSIPFSKSTRILFYNKTLLDEHDLEVPKTWDELIEVAKILTEGDTVGMGFENSFESEFYGLLVQHGGTIIDEDAGVAYFASDEGVQALTVIYDMVENNIARFAGEDGHLSGPFGHGSVAMYIGASPGIPHVKSGMKEGVEWGTTTIPSLNGEQATLFAGNDLVMFDTGDEKEQRAAWEFMKYLLEPSVTAKWAMLSGYIPVRYSANDLPEYVEFLEENPVYKAASDQFDAGFISPRVSGANAIRNIVLEELDEIMLGRKSVAEGLQETQDRANEILAKEQ